MRLLCQGLALLLPALLSACGPMSPELAARHCEERARLAVGPRGWVGVGASTKASGPVMRGEVSVSSDWIAGRDPYQLYDSCVRQKSGQGPIRPPDLG